MGWPKTWGRLPRRRFHRVVDDDRALRRLLFARMTGETAAAQDHIIRLGSTSAEERVATFLLTTARKTGADLKTPVEITLPFRRVDIADFLGVTVETVSREISKLKKDGLIALRGPHRVVLKEIRTLRVIAKLEDEQGTAIDLLEGETGPVHLPFYPGTHMAA